MDFNIIIASLSLLLAGLAELRGQHKDRSQTRRSQLALSLLKLLKILDNIILVGEEIVIHLNTIQNHGLRYYRVRMTRLVERQLDNLKAFSEIYELPISLEKERLPITFGDYIELHVPDKIQTRKTKKRFLKKVLTWKSTKKKPSFTVASTVTHEALEVLLEKTKITQIKRPAKINPDIGLVVRTPKKIAVGLWTFNNTNAEKVEVLDTELYDLDNPEDILRAIENAKEQLEELRDLRIRLAGFMRTSFTIDDLVS